MSSPPSVRLRVGCEFSFDVPAPVAAVFQVEPRTEPRQALVSERLEFDQGGAPSVYQDTFGNTCSRLLVPAGPLSLRYDATFDVPRVPDETDPDAAEVPVGDLPDEVLLYLLPSRFCLSDVLFDEAWDRFGSLPSGWRRVQAIVDSVHEHLQFGYGTSSPVYTAADAFAAGKGVCRDFAHLAISFCRALNIPARYVFGYLPDLDVPPDPAPMDFAAWMEVWLMLALCRAGGIAARYVSGHLVGQGGTHAWVEVLVTSGVVALDPCHGRRADERYVTVAVGRDYRDVPPTSGSYLGSACGRLTTARRLDVVERAAA